FADFPTLFKASFIIAVIGVICIMGISYKENSTEKKARISLESFFEPRVFFLSWLMFFTAVVYGGIVSFITLYGKDIGIENAGIYFLAYALTLLFIRPLAGMHFDKNGPARIMIAGFISIALSFVLLFAAHSMPLFLLSAVAMGIGFGIVQPTAMAMAINRVTPNRRGAANGTIMSAFDLGIGLGSILLGFVSKVVGLSYMYLSCSIIILIPLDLFYLKEARTTAQSPE
ncbi:MAG: MFS transporter, partial [Desulfocucumaceae bacterium]